MDQPGGHTLIFTILIYLHILHKTLTDFEFIRLQNLSIFGLFMKSGSKYWMDIQIDSEIHHLSFFRCIGYKSDLPF